MKAKDERETFFGIQELAEVFGRSEEVVRTWLREGALKAIPQWTQDGPIFRERKAASAVGTRGQKILVKVEDFGRWCEENNFDAEA